jgi:hypothetical protein
LYVLALTALAGAALVFYSRLAARSPRRAKLLVLGSAAAALSLFSAFMLYLSIRFALLIVSLFHGGISHDYLLSTMGVLSILVLFIGLEALAMAVSFWKKFYRVLKRGEDPIR